MTGGPAEPITAEAVAPQVRKALESADVSAIGALLSPSVRWGPPDVPAPPCQNRQQVLEWYRRGREAGTRARVTEVSVFGDKILVGMMVRRGGEYDERWQILTVAPDGVSDMCGFEDRRSATAFAGV